MSAIFFTTKKANVLVVPDIPSTDYQAIQSHWCPHFSYKLQLSDKKVRYDVIREDVHTIWTSAIRFCKKYVSRNVLHLPLLFPTRRFVFLMKYLVVTLKLKQILQ